MKKVKFIEKLTIGERFENELFLVNELDVTEGTLKLLLSDKTGSLRGEILESNITGAIAVGMVICCNGLVTADNCAPYLRMQSARETKEFLPAEIYSGISVPQAELYKKDIKSVISAINHLGYRQLCEAALTDHVLQRLAVLPCTLSYYGSYGGAALVATATIPHMCIQAMSAYTKRGNGISSTAPSWDVLITAGLLCNVGRTKYFTSEPPYQKSIYGVTLGYFSTLQSVIEQVIKDNNVVLSDDEVARLLNILNVGVSSKTEVKSVSKEGSTLRHILALYAECDRCDWEIANHVGDESFYSDKLGKYIVV